MTYRIYRVIYIDPCIMGLQVKYFGLDVDSAREYALELRRNGIPYVRLAFSDWSVYPITDEVRLK